MNSTIKNNIANLYTYSEEYFEEVRQKHVIIIINLQNSPDNATLRIDQANKVERFTTIEYQEIVESIDELNIDYTIYYNELEFISDVVNEKLKINDIIVFNFARNGLKEGKKSLIPSFCDLLNIIYTGSGAFTQSLCRNKFVYNKYLQQIGITVPQTCGYTPYKEWMGGVTPNNLNKTIIKPIAESGSIGVSKEIIQYDSWDKNKVEFIHDQTMLVQEYIEGNEVECPFFVFDGKVVALPAIQLKMNNKNFLDIETSTNNDYTFSILNEQDANHLYPLLNKIVSALNIKGYGRADFRINTDGKSFLFDIATMPFICEHSSFTFAMRHLKYKRSDIFKIILSIAIKNKS